MPRQARLIIDNACYHVITRGNQKQAIFRDKHDRLTYLKFMSKYKEKYKFKIYGWCLMDNHIHMIMESDCLGKAMHGLNLSYAQYFRYKYKSVGHFWQDRYKSYVIQKDKYLINCISYIEYNPVRANITLRPEDYDWSSYKARIIGKQDRLLDELSL
jgi:putative transposase